MKVNRFLRFGAALAAAAVAASAEAEQPAIDLTGGILSFRGPITPAVLSVFQRVSWQKVRLVRVQSEGGDIATSIRLGQLLSAKSVPVEVHDDCESACFNILVAGPKTTIDSGTLVLLHQSISGQFALVRLRYPKLIEGQRASAAEESSWLRRNGVDPDVLVFSEWMTTPECISAPEDAPSSAPLLKVSHRYAVWAPRDETLRRAGVRLGSWKQNAGLVSREMSERHPGADMHLMRNGDEPQWSPHTVSVAKAELGKVRRCG